MLLWPVLRLSNYSVCRCTGVSQECSLRPARYRWIGIFFPRRPRCISSGPLLKQKIQRIEWMIALSTPDRTVSSGNECSIQGISRHALGATCK